MVSGGGKWLMGKGLSLKVKENRAGSTSSLVFFLMLFSDKYG
jgi:hypothetical protein